MLQTATNIRCEACALKLCKLKDVDGTLYVELKHKGKSRVLAKEIIIHCFGCGVKYRVNAENKTIEEIS